MSHGSALKGPPQPHKYVFQARSLMCALSFVYHPCTIMALKEEVQKRSSDSIRLPDEVLREVRQKRSTDIRKSGLLGEASDILLPKKPLFSYPTDGSIALSVVALFSFSAILQKAKIADHGFICFVRIYFYLLLKHTCVN